MENKRDYNSYVDNSCFDELNSWIQFYEDHLIQFFECDHEGDCEEFNRELRQSIYKAAQELPEHYEDFIEKGVKVYYPEKYKAKEQSFKKFKSIIDKIKKESDLIKGKRHLSDAFSEAAAELKSFLFNQELREYNN